MSRIAVYIPSFSDGGVEKMMVTLASGFAQAGQDTDFLTRGDGLPYLERLDRRVQRFALARTRSALADYLRTRRPAVLLSAKGKDDTVAVAARDLAGAGTRVFLRCGTHLSSRPSMSGINPVRRWLRLRRLRDLYARADGVVCISRGVADDVSRVTGVPRARLAVVHNPVITPAFAAELDAPCPHPWFAAGQPGVILGAGSLAPVKRFDVLLDAVAPLLAERNLRLVILGDGKERHTLLGRAARLGVRERFDLPGFAGNVLPYMRRCAVFVLTSEREGWANVLAEALATGAPVVATDCPSGPREMLADGRHGPLVPVADPVALRRAVGAVLDDPPDAQVQRAAVAAYTLPAAVAGYLAAFGLA